MSKEYKLFDFVTISNKKIFLHINDYISGAHGGEVSQTTKPN